MNKKYGVKRLLVGSVFGILFCGGGFSPLRPASQASRPASPASSFAAAASPSSPSGNPRQGTPPKNGGSGSSGGTSLTSGSGGSSGSQYSSASSTSGTSSSGRTVTPGISSPSRTKNPQGTGTPGSGAGAGAGAGATTPVPAVRTETVYSYFTVSNGDIDVKAIKACTLEKMKELLSKHGCSIGDIGAFLESYRQLDVVSGGKKSDERKKLEGVFVRVGELLLETCLDQLRGFVVAERDGGTTSKRRSRYKQLKMQMKIYLRDRADGIGFSLPGFFDGTVMDPKKNNIHQETIKNIVKTNRKEEEDLQKAKVAQELQPRQGGEDAGAADSETGQANPGKKDKKDPSAGANGSNLNDSGSLSDQDAGVAGSGAGQTNPRKKDKKDLSEEELRRRGRLLYSSYRSVWRSNTLAKHYFQKADLKPTSAMERERLDLFSKLEVIKELKKIAYLMNNGFLFKAPSYESVDRNKPRLRRLWELVSKKVFPVILDGEKWDDLIHVFMTVYSTQSLETPTLLGYAASFIGSVWRAVLTNKRYDEKAMQIVIRKMIKGGLISRFYRDESGANAFAYLVDGTEKSKVYKRLEHRFGKRKYALKASHVLQLVSDYSKEFRGIGKSKVKSMLISDGISYSARTLSNFIEHKLRSKESIQMRINLVYEKFKDIKRVDFNLRKIAYITRSLEAIEVAACCDAIVSDMKRVGLYGGPRVVDIINANIEKTFEKKVLSLCPSGSKERELFSFLSIVYPQFKSRYDVGRFSFPRPVFFRAEYGAYNERYDKSGRLIAALLASKMLIPVVYVSTRSFEFNSEKLRLFSDMLSNFLKDKDWGLVVDHASDSLREPELEHIRKKSWETALISFIDRHARKRVTSAILQKGHSLFGGEELTLPHGFYDDNPDMSSIMAGVDTHRTSHISDFTQGGSSNPSQRAGAGAGSQIAGSPLRRPDGSITSGVSSLHGDEVAPKTFHWQ